MVKVFVLPHNAQPQNVLDIHRSSCIETKVAAPWLVISEICSDALKDGYVLYILKH